MTNDWPLVPLDEVLRKSEDWIDIDPVQQYAQITVRLWGKGVALRGKMLGSEIAASRQLRIHREQFILSRIDARNGALGLVPDELDGAVVSNDFPAFDVDECRLSPAYLAWVSKTHDFVDLCKRASEGTTNRVRLKEDRFLAAEIALPPLDEQRRIVARIEALAHRIEQARGLRREAEQDCDALCRSIIFSDTSRAVSTPMRELVRQRALDVTVLPDEKYHFAGIYSFGRGVFQGPIKTGAEFTYPRLTRLRTGDFVYPKLMAWEGAMSVVPPNCDGLVVSPEFPVFEVDTSRVLPEVLDVYFRTPSTWPLISGQSTGTNVRRRRLQPADFLAFSFPLTPMSTQLRLRDIKAKLDEVKRLQAETAEELEALLPSVLDRAFRGEL